MTMTRFMLNRLAAVVLAITAVCQAPVDSAEVVTGIDPSGLVEVREVGAVGDGMWVMTSNRLAT